ncbi:MAG: hypothetical protein AB7E04_08505 [Desulfobacteraceae bacterium]
MDFPDKFKNIKAVLDFLKTNGFKIEKSKIYEDAKEGLLRVQKNKSVMGIDVKLYSGTLKRDGSADPEPAELTAEKLKKESLKLDLQNEKLQFELDKEKGKYLPRSDFERELAARAAVLDSGIRHSLSLKVQDIIALVGGQLSKAPDLIDYIDKIIDESMNIYATTQTFQIMVIGDEDSISVS